MNRDDIIRMAREAFNQRVDYTVWTFSTPHLEAFADLVAAAERERIKWDSIHSCHPECDKPVCVAIRKAVEEEREACAMTVANIAGDEQYRWAAMAIRERGAP